MDKDVCKKILTIGCAYKPPRGGIAQVLSNYDHLLFAPFKFVRNSADGNKLKKVWVMAWGLVETFSRLLFNRKIKVVHIHTASRNSFRRSAVYMRLAKFMGRKIVMHIHGGGFKDYYNGHKAFVDGVLPKCDCIVALSQDWANYFVEELHCSNVQVVNNLIESPVHLSIERGDMLHLLFLGLINEKKGVFDMLKLLAAKKNRYGGRLVFHVAGNGETERFRQEIDNLGIAEMVRFEGWASGEKKQLLLNQCDVFVLPSYIEGLPLSVLEAMTYSKAVIASRVGAIPSIVHEGENGFLIEPGDMEAMEEAIDRFLDDPSLLSSFGTSSYRLAQPFLKEEVERQLIKCYQTIL